MLSEPNADFWVRQGASIINGIIQRHVNRGRYEELEAWDFIEFTDVDGAPWEEDNQILCDPGHALEFIGLATKFLLAAQSSQVQSNELQNVLVLCRDVLPALFVHVFRCGFDTVNEGIYKTIDLKSRRPVNDELPWSLPETIRVCALLPKVFSENAPKEIPEIWQCCHDALF
jgi:mannose/cellobiose epimerase-like protein (N-acyl-D-glucosamine 2-epimerase family)